MEESSGSSTGRAKRQKIDKTGRFAALEKLRNLKGTKNKYDVGEVENVYEEVDEREYSKRVLQRQDDDWIVDDGGDYVEDGREIFDDDLDEESILDHSKKSKKSLKKNVSDKANNSSKNIASMLANMPSKKKKVAPTKVDEDALLGDLMEELTNEKKDTSYSSMLSKDYLKSFSSNKKLNVDAIIKPKINPSRLSSRISQRVEVVDVKEEIKIKKEIETSPVKVIEEEYPDFDNGYDEPMETIDVEEPVKIEEPLEVKKNGHDKKTEHDDFEDMSIDDFQLDNFSEPKVVEEKKPIKIEPEITEKCLDEGWETTTANVNVTHENITWDTSTLPMATNKEGEKVFRFYWWDAFEEPFKQPGVVYLFGKVYIESAKAYVSCCVTVRDIPRRIYLLPRQNRHDLKSNTPTDQPVAILDVYEEFNKKVAEPNKIMNFKSRKIHKKYAFDLLDVPAESEYLEIRYPSKDIKLSADLAGETFSKVFGTNTSSLELLLVERKIKGPCWIEIKNPQPAKIVSSWCKIDVICTKPEDVIISSDKAPPPPLTVMALNLRTVVNPKMQNEIVMISALVHNSYQIDKPAPNPGFNSHFCAFTRLSDVPWPFDLNKHLSNYKGTQIFKHDAERSLLNFFLTKLYQIDPDLIVGHDLYGYTIDTLIHRIEHLKIPNWSRIGRLKRSIIPQIKGKVFDKNLTCGRLVCDIHISSKELIRARSYDLDSLCKLILKVSENARQDFTPEEIKEMYSKAPSLLRLINATMQDTNFILKLMYELNVLPLALQITNIAGNVMSKTLLGGRSERNEFLLLHAFTEKDFIVPDKSYGKKKAIVNEEDTELEPKSSKKKPQYAGGLVLEPKKGFYDKFILLMDFNSLYPSIIQEYNICFTTVTRTDDEDAEPELPNSNSPPGILPIEIKKLVESRRQVKALMKEPNLSSELKSQYNIRQTALKLTANSMYGCLGFSHSRFYAKPLAALITSRGREILMNTRDVVQKMNFEVIYGDTDSIMINTNCIDYDQVFKIGNKIKQEINKLYKHVELEVDGVFKYMLLLKKKKYAAIVLSKKPNGELIATQEYKGLDIVRRDWSQLSAEVGRHVLDQILSDLTPDERIANIREHLEKIASDLRNKAVPLPLLAITKQLAKDPEHYADKKSLPHLQVAMRINSRGGKKLKSGDTVSYVICDDGSNLPAVQRAYHVDELKNNENLIIDVNYYLSQQIHPVVSRLCEPIDGADSAFIAECLGLDPTSYKRNIQRNQEEEDGEEGDYTLINDVNSFKNCEKFSFTCMNEKCKTKIFMDGPMHDNYLALSRCRNQACKTAPVEYLPSIQNALQLAIRGYVDKLYQNWIICEDPACPNRTRRVPMMFINSFPVCTMCKKGLMYREYRNADLYYQLKYFEFMFNVKKIKIPMSSQLDNAYKSLHSQVTEVLNFSGYRVLDFSKIFKFAFREDKGKMKVTDLQRALMESQKQWQQVK